MRESGAHHSGDTGQEQSTFLPDFKSQTLDTHTGTHTRTSSLTPLYSHKSGMTNTSNSSLFSFCRLVCFQHLRRGFLWGLRVSLLWAGARLEGQVLCVRSVLHLCSLIHCSPQPRSPEGGLRSKPSGRLSHSHTRIPSFSSAGKSLDKYIGEKIKSRL